MSVCLATDYFADLISRGNLLPNHRLAEFTARPAASAAPHLLVNRLRATGLSSLADQVADQDIANQAEVHLIVSSL